MTWASITLSKLTCEEMIALGGSVTDRSLHFGHTHSDSCGRFKKSAAVEPKIEGKFVTWNTATKDWYPDIERDSTKAPVSDRTVTVELNMENKMLKFTGHRAVCIQLAENMPILIDGYHQLLQKGTVPDLK